MMTTQPTRTAARCADCGRAYAVRQMADGGLLPIGSTGGCACGATTFREIR